VAAGGVGVFSLSVVEGWLPLGTYTGTLQFSTAGTESVTATGIVTATGVVTAAGSVTVTELLTVTERVASTEGVLATKAFVLLVSPWNAELEWAQEEFFYVAGVEHSSVSVMARYTDATDIQAHLPTLASQDRVTAPFSTRDFLTITYPTTLTRDSPCELTLTFTATHLPVPGTYVGVLRLSASNAAPITAPFTLVVPDRARGSYRLVVAELGQTSALTNSLPLTTALQFTGVRWLPGSTGVVGWWPTVAGALLLVAGSVTLVLYTQWAGQKAWFWAVVSLAAAGVVWLVLSVILSDSTQAHVGERKLLIWEAEGRGPVRNVTVLAEEVANAVGDTGAIDIGHYDREIKPGHLLTVPVIGVQHLSQPGVYQGRILIQSPDIAAGVQEVPVQVTIRDFVLWPVLVILLGVVVGGWAKYLQEIASKRFEKRREIEKEWQRWDDDMVRDPCRYTSRGEEEERRIINPIYAEVRQDLDYALRLLNLEDEWGAADASDILTEVEERRKEYKRVGKEVTYWSQELENGGAVPRTREAARWINEVELALRWGKLTTATGRLHEGRGTALRLRVDGLREKTLPTVPDEARQAIKGLLDQAEGEKDYDKAWSYLQEAEEKIRAQGIAVLPLTAIPPRPSLFPLPPKEVTPLERPAPEERYEIRLPSPPVRYYRAEDRIPLRVVYRGESPPPKVEFAWAAKREEDSEASADFRPRKGIDTLVEFPEEGHWTVTVHVTPTGNTEDEELPQPEPLSLSITIKPSRMMMIYRDKRRHNFNRRLAAGLVALVGGMAARQVFGLTFGSFAQYLGAFGWGVGVSLGTDPVADGYSNLKTLLKKLLKLDLSEEGSSESEEGSSKNREEPGQTS
jgi:hypothetical protein